MSTSNTPSDNVQFEHVLNTFFEPDSAVRRFLDKNGVNNVRSLKSRWKKWRKEDELEYTDPDDTDTKKNLSEEELEELHGLISFINDEQNALGPIRSCPLNLTAFTKENFQDFLMDFDPDHPIEYDRERARVSKHNEDKRKFEMDSLRKLHDQQLASTTANTMTGGITTTSTSTTGGGGSGSNSTGSGGGNRSDPLVEELQRLLKSQKPDIDAYEEFKDPDDYCDWELGFIVDAEIQGFGNILDENYTPAPGNETKLFETRKKLMYSFLKKILKTEKGKDLLAKYSKTTDAQKIISELTAIQLIVQP